MGEAFYPMSALFVARSLLVFLRFKIAIAVRRNAIYITLSLFNRWGPLRRYAWAWREPFMLMMLMTLTQLNFMLLIPVAILQPKKQWSEFHLGVNMKKRTWSILLFQSLTCVIYFRYWSTVSVPHGTSAFQAICPFCATELEGNPGYVKLKFNQGVK